MLSISHLCDFTVKSIKLLFSCLILVVMPKAEVGTPKWLSNKMKSKGLQRLRWYCQLCEKQCRDENGFKCHRQSEQHKLQMDILLQNPQQFMDEYSREFEDSFMHLMETRYRSQRVLANIVYRDVISDRNHIHMNATVWETLSQFVSYLEKSKKVRVVERTLKDSVIEYIDKDRMDRELKKMNDQLEEASREDKIWKQREKIVKEAKRLGTWQDSSSAATKSEAIGNAEGRDKIVLLQGSIPLKTTTTTTAAVSRNVLFEGEGDEEEETDQFSSNNSGANKRMRFIPPPTSNHPTARHPKTYTV